MNCEVPAGNLVSNLNKDLVSVIQGVLDVNMKWILLILMEFAPSFFPPAIVTSVLTNKLILIELTYQLTVAYWN